jgi:cob(I)alamin adenosyltransferase
MHMEAATLEHAYVQVYTGNGKGKTTAALGLALRAAGAGMKVYFAQFIKNGRFNEMVALERYADRVTVRQFGRGRFIQGGTTDADLAAARQGLAEIRMAVGSGDYGVVVLDEANVAVQCGLLCVQDILALVAGAHPGVELVITGRDAPVELIERADLVTEMKEVKHYYHQGVLARDGIEK